MVRSKLLPLLVLSCFLCQKTICQEIIKVSAGGKSTSPGNLSPKDARVDAINEAKKNALQKVGVKENISISSILYTIEGRNSFAQFFNEIFVNESDGEIVVDSVADKSKYFLDGYLVYEVEIYATVFKYNKKNDPGFTFATNGINEIYFTNEKLSFDFIPAYDGYLKIFNTNNNTASLLYPAKFDNENELFSKNQVFSFPLSRAYKPGYTLRVDNEEDDFEINNLIFVFTKKNISSPAKYEINDILKWIYGISPDERFIRYYSIIIKKTKSNENFIKE